jgi:hypothetical protein
MHLFPVLVIALTALSVRCHIVHAPRLCEDALCPAPSRSARALAEASLPPARTCPDPSAPSPGCSCSSVCRDFLRQGICRQLRTWSTLRRSIRRGSLEVSMEGTFVNDAELDKHVFCLVNSKKRHIGAPAESLLELISGSEAVTA